MLSDLEEKKKKDLYLDIFPPDRQTDRQKDSQSPKGWQYQYIILLGKFTTARTIGTTLTSALRTNNCGGLVASVRGRDFNRY